MSSKANGAPKSVATSKEQTNDSIPSLSELQDLERKLQGNLVKVENDIYVTETKYIKLTTHSGGNVFKGWEGGQTNHKPLAIVALSGTNRRNRNANQEKFFTLSSLSAP